VESQPRFHAAPAHEPSGAWRASSCAPQPSCATRACSAATSSSGASVRSRITCQRIAGSESNSHAFTELDGVGSERIRDRDDHDPERHRGQRKSDLSRELPARPQVEDVVERADDRRDRAAAEKPEELTLREPGVFERGSEPAVEDKRADRDDEERRRHGEAAAARDRDRVHAPRVRAVDHAPRPDEVADERRQDEGDRRGDRERDEERRRDRAEIRQELHARRRASVAREAGDREAPREARDLSREAGLLVGIGAPGDGLADEPADRAHLVGPEATRRRRRRPEPDA